MKSRDAPQAATVPGGWLWIHSCRAATPMVASVVSINNAAYTRRPQPAGSWAAARANTTPVAKMPTRWKIHRGQGSRCSTNCA